MVKFNEGNPQFTERAADELSLYEISLDELLGPEYATVIYLYSRDVVYAIYQPSCAANKTASNFSVFVVFVTAENKSTINNSQPRYHIYQHNC